MIKLYFVFLLYLLCTSSPLHAEDRPDENEPLTKISLQLKWLHQFQFAGYYAALEKGFYKEEGLDVEIRERNKSINHIEEVLQGKADFGISDSSLILYRLRGSPVVVVAAIFQHSPLVIITRAEDKILGPLELKGKRVMMQYGIDAAALTAMFSHMQIKMKDMTILPHSLDDNSLIRKETDAISGYLTNQPFSYPEKGLEINVINPMNYGIDFYGDMLFTNEKLMRSDPDAVMRFRNASIRGWTYALAHKEEIIELIHTKYHSKKSLKALRFEAEALERMILPDLIEIGHLNAQRFNRIASIYIAEKMATADSTIDGIDYKQYLEEQNKLPRWVWWIIVGTAALVALLLLLIVLNWRLHCFVHAKTRAIRQIASKLQRYVNLVDKYIITSQTDTDGIITTVSDAFCQISGYSREELIGQPHNIIRNPKMPSQFFRKLWTTIQSGKTWQGEILNRNKKGEDYWVQGNIEPLLDKAGAITGYSSIRINITDKKRIEDLSQHDRLTGLFNRNKLDAIFQQETTRSNRYDNGFSVIILDIDHFKQVNDTYGHQVGDSVLVEFAEILRTKTRESDITGRWGGEEFIIICPNTTSEGAKSLAETLRAAIEAHTFNTAGKKTSSFGVSEFIHGESIDTLISRADSALYEAKTTGRNRVVSK